MMRVVCIGIGGSGAAGVEALVHLTALGLLNRDGDGEHAELIPFVVDVDESHPRIKGCQEFIREYNDVRGNQPRQAQGFLGTAIQDVTAPFRPSPHSNLFGLLELHKPDNRALARLFFDRREQGRAESREFADGYYGRVNAGVCFYHDQAALVPLINSVKPLLADEQTVVVIMGSNFGGTGAAGLLRLAGVLRKEALAVPIAVVQFEPYFKPVKPADGSGADHFINEPETFHARARASYEMMRELARAQKLPFNVLYALGASQPAGFRVEWFRRDQQDNPHLLVEYLAALAVRDFARGGAAVRPAAPAIRMRAEISEPNAGDPIDVFRRLLWSAAIGHRLLSAFVLPLLDAPQAERGRLPGHPWLHDVIQRCGLSTGALKSHLTGCRQLLDRIIVAAGIQEATGVDHATDRQKATRDSFPEQFLPLLDDLRLVHEMGGVDPSDLFNTGPAQWPGAGMLSWVETHATRVNTYHHGADRGGANPVYQLVQQENQGAGSVLNLGYPGAAGDNNFHNVTAGGPGGAGALAKLAGAAWDVPATSHNDHGLWPTVWAPALAHRERLIRRGPTSPLDDRDMLHLGLLGAALVRTAHAVAPPIRAVPLSGIPPAFAGAMQHTALESHFAAVTCGVRGEDTRGLMVVNWEGHDVGYLYPDLGAVPAVDMTAECREHLIEWGRYLAADGFGSVLRGHLQHNWIDALQQSHVADAATRGQHFLDMLGRFSSGPGKLLRWKRSETSLVDRPAWVDVLFA